VFEDDRKMEGTNLRFRFANGAEVAEVDGLSVEEEAVVRRLPEAILYCRSMPAFTPCNPPSHLTRSSLHRCLRRHGIPRLPEVEGEAAKRKFEACPIGNFHIDIAEVRTAQGKLYLLVAIDRTSKSCVEL
jgi:hypothetical protein